MLALKPNQLKPFLFGLLCLGLLCVGVVYNASAELPEDSLRQQNDAALAVDGYSVVSYFQRGKAERGNVSFQAIHEGLTYYFTDTEQVELFQQSPDKYIPAHGGWCSLMLSGSGNLTPANPEHFKIVDDQLLLFWGGDFKGQAISGLSNWNSKTNGKPKRDSKRLRTANAAWAKVQSRARQPKLLTFSPNDYTRLNEAQREVARKQY